MIYDFDPLYSAYPQYRNQSFKYFLTDTEERFLRRNSDQKKELQSYGLLDKDINYTFNSYGFRSNEFQEPGSGIIFLGCSYTFGFGIGIEDSFTHIVSKELRLNNYNLGLCGGGPDSSFRIGHYWIPKLKPKYIIYTNIFSIRSEEILKPDKVVSYYPLHPTNPNKDPMDRFSHIHWDLNNLKSLYSLKYISQELNIPFYNITEFPILDHARDLEHPGKMSNEEFAEEILTQIQDRGE